MLGATIITSRAKAVIRFSIILITVLLFVLFSGNDQLLGNNGSVQFSEKVNLAIRRTAHHLLVASGDSVSLISPVEQSDANTFTIKLNWLFDYSKLPKILQESFDLHGIKRAYDVTILDCNSGQIQLGYNFKDFKQEAVPCLDRKQESGCYNLKVSFYPETQTAAANTNWWFLPFGSLLAGLSYLVWKKRRTENTFSAPQEILTEKKNSTQQFGKSVLDMPNLVLVSDHHSYNLTYREAKLLNLFVMNKNQILERDFILKSVWEDEGIIVGRSVDVFVSRLRKMLQNDELIKIAAVHGVGYRMEVSGI